MGSRSIDSIALAKIADRLKSSIVPAGLCRLPVSINITADEWKNWTICFSIYCLGDLLLLHQRVWSNAQCLAISFWVLQWHFGGQSINWTTVKVSLPKVITCISICIMKLSCGPRDACTCMLNLISFTCFLVSGVAVAVSGIRGTRGKCVEFWDVLKRLPVVVWIEK